MKRLNRKQSSEKASHVQAINTAKEKLEEVILEYNSKMGAAWGPVQEALDKLNQAVAEANEFRDDICTQQQDYYDERSEKWQEGDAGSSYSSWMEEWDSELEEVRMEPPEELEVPDCSEALDQLEQLPEEVSE